jgi:hypothetical protein
MLSEVARLFRVNGRPASVGENAIKEARLAVEARSFMDGRRFQAPIRVAGHGDVVYIDRGTDDWSVFRVVAGTVDVVPRAPVPIIRTRRTGPLPDLHRPGSLDGLRRLLSRISDNDFVLLVAWCLGALNPAGPYPILIVGGEAGSGKSTLVRLVQRLVDPVIGDILQPPADDRDLIAAAKNGRVLAFDNLSKIGTDLADSLCRLATGSEIGGRALFTNHDSASFAACRPIILNGIPDLAARGDLADRSIVIRLGALAQYMTERDWARETEEALPAAFTGLVAAFAMGLSSLESVGTPNVRMADFARLAIAAEPALPCLPGTFLEAYLANRRDSTVLLVEGDLVASSISAFVERHPEGWTGLKSQLHQILGDALSPEAKKSGDWPGNARWFADRLRRAAPSLRSIGIAISERRDAAGVRVTISRAAAPAALAAQEQLGTEASVPGHVARAANAAVELVDGLAGQSAWKERI